MAFVHDNKSLKTDMTHVSIFQWEENSDFTKLFDIFILQRIILKSGFRLILSL
jgi:hypothetical protein